MAYIGQYPNIKIGTKFFENVEQIKYLGKTVRNQNYIHEKMKSRLNSGKSGIHCRNFLLPVFY